MSKFGLKNKTCDPFPASTYIGRCYADGGSNKFPTNQPSRLVARG